MSPTYRYQTFNLLTGAVGEDLPLSGVKWTKALMNPGSASGYYPLAADDTTQRLKDATTPGMTGLNIFRNDYPIWDGIIWQRKYDRSNRQVSLTCQTMETYWAKRYQRSLHTFVSIGVDSEQIDIARWLLLGARSTASGNILIDTDTTTTSGIHRDRTFGWWEFKTVLEELNAAANLEGGFEYRLEAYIKTDGTVGHRILFGSPKVGRTADNTDLTFTFPGNILNFTADEDAQGATNRMYAIGAGEEASQLESIASDSTTLGHGYPLLEDSISYKDVNVPATLAAHARFDLSVRLVPITLLSVDYNPAANKTEDPELSRVVPGDYAKFQISDPWFGTTPFTVTDRITQLDVTVADQGGTETVSLTLGSGADS